MIVLAIFQSSACLLAGVVIAAWLRRPARAHRFVVLASFCAFLVPILSFFFQEMGVGLWAPREIPAGSSLATDNLGTRFVGPVAGNGATNLPSPPATDGSHGMALAAWGAFSAAYVVVLMRGWRRTHLIAKGSRLSGNADIISAAEDAANRLKVNVPPEIRETAAIGCPALWSWGRPKSILMPPTTTSTEKKISFDHILLHELAHHQRKDHLASLLAELTIVAMPWNPLTWWVRSAIRKYSELACDDWVLHCAGQADVYSSTLLHFTQGTPAPWAHAASGGPSQVKARINRILDERGTQLPWSGRAWTLSTVASALIVGLLAAAAQPRAQIEDASLPALPLGNVSFEKGATAPDDWSQGAAIEGVEYIWSDDAAHTGKRSIGFRKTIDRFFPVAQWRTTVPREGDAPYLRVRAWVKAEDAHKAILDVQFVDENGEWSHEWAAYIGSREENDPAANHDWTLYEGVVEIPPGTKTIVIAPQMYGPGTVWFDDISAEYVSRREESDPEVSPESNGNGQ